MNLHNLDLIHQNSKCTFNIKNSLIKILIDKNLLCDYDFSKYNLFNNIPWKFNKIINGMIILTFDGYLSKKSFSYTEKIWGWGELKDKYTSKILKYSIKQKDIEKFSLIESNNTHFILKNIFLEINK